MPKDEKIWIQDNYYNGFLRGCLGNELIEETPSKTALENAGCQISALCYLILPDQSQHNPRTMKPNEFPTSIRKLFEIEAANFDLDDDVFGEKAESEETSSVVTDPKTISDMLSDATSKVCEECNQQKPIEAFAKMRGRGVRRQSVCIECQTKAKALASQVKPDVHPQPASIEDDIKDVEAVEANPMAVVSIDYLKKIANEAFNRGREYERSNIDTVAPSLDELLEIGA
ncbi:MAG: hypothetical protein JZU49_02915 [Sulfuricurvum sp.]|nr:hypothetical protein [Sulfuricurvum sp.]